MALTKAQKERLERRKRKQQLQEQQQQNGQSNVKSTSEQGVNEQNATYVTNNDIEPYVSKKIGKSDQEAAAQYVIKKKEDHKRESINEDRSTRKIKQVFAQRSGEPPMPM